MFNSIFNISFFSGFGGMGLILLVVILYFKFPKQTTAVLKVIGCIVLFVALPISAVFGVVNINGYYSASGGIFGQIKDSLGLNVGEVSTDTFEVSGLNLRLDENGEYTAVITVDLESDDVNLSLDPNKDYLILVNGGLTTNSFKSTTGGSIALSADYTYSFSNYDREEVLKDTLKISFVVNKDNIVCRLSTSGGATARDLWKLYYAKNGMTFKFVETTYLPTSPSEGEGDTSQYCVLSFYDGDELVTTRVHKIGTELTDIPTISKYGYIFDGWSIDGVEVYNFNQPIGEDQTFSALFTRNTTWITVNSDDDFCSASVSWADIQAEGVFDQEIIMNSYTLDELGDTEALNVRLNIERLGFRRYMNQPYWVDGERFDCIAINSNKEAYYVSTSDSHMYGDETCDISVTVGDSFSFEIMGESHIFTFVGFTSKTNNVLEFTFKCSNITSEDAFVSFIGINGIQIEIGI